MPPFNYHGGLPPSTSLTPTSDNRGMPQRQTAHYHSPTQSKQTKQAGGLVLNHRQIRPLTVNEALQYSPLSSIVPYDPAIVPLPNVGIPNNQSIFSTAAERRAARQSLELLDRSLIENRRQPGPARFALENLHKLLEPGEISAFKFKIPHSLRSTSQNSTAIPFGNAKNSSQLGPFANMVLNSTNIIFRYPTPTSRASSPSEVTTIPKEIQAFPSKTTVTPETPPHDLDSHLAYAHKSNIPIQGDDSSAPPPTQFKPVVIVPRLQAPIIATTYSVNDREPSHKRTAQASSKKRKRDHAEYDESTGSMQDQRAISDEALSKLQDLISAILETENSAQSDRELELAGTNSLLVPSEGWEGRVLTLASAVHVKLDACLQKAIFLNRLKDVPVDHLCRVQKLCEGSLATAEITDIRLQAGWTDDDISAWLERIDQADAGLRSARTILRIMTGGRDERQLYPEEMVQKLLIVTRKVMDSCLIPIVESRPSGAGSKLFDVAVAHKKVISQMLHDTSKILQLLLDLLVKVELVEASVTSIEFFAISLLFVENAHNEKDSALGTHKFEVLRRIAMILVAQIFSRYPEQRRYILDEVLTSLQKLPTTRQHARQFKLGDAKSMQLVSALLMRLVQASGSTSASKLVRKRKRTLSELSRVAASNLSASSEDPASDLRDSDDDSPPDDVDAVSHEISRQEVDSGGLPEHLIRKTKLLYESALRDAQYIVNFFVTRASSASKAGDQPHRHLLDIFVEDLVTVLSLPEWPASELILRALVSKMNEIVTCDKSTAPAKTMALETLGLMGSAISDIIAGAQHLLKAAESDESPLSTRLSGDLADHLAGDFDSNLLIEWTGPYRAVLEYLDTNSSDPHNVTARDYLVTQWTKFALWGNRGMNESARDLKSDNRYKDLATKLCILTASGESAITDDFGPISYVQCRLAYSLILLNKGFCRSFGFIIKILLEAVTSEHTTIRSRSLKSITQMVEKDPTLLERTPQVLNLISRCTADQSPMVRDSALVLISKCIVLKPTLELDFLRPIIACTNDNTVGVRKRSLKMLKDIYIGNSERELRSAIADSLLQRIQDQEGSVSDIAKQILEDVWLNPFWTINAQENQSAAYKVNIKDQVALIVKTLQRGESMVSALNSFLSQVLSQSWKSASANSFACKAIIAEAMEQMTGPEDISGDQNQQHILHTLTVFARACPLLFTPQQLQHLQPYVTNLATADDLLVFRSVVIIFRSVLPTLSIMQKDFLKQVQDDLMKNVTKLAKAELDEVCGCLWTLNSALQNVERLLKIEMSVLTQMHKLEATDFGQSNRQQELSRVKRYIQLASHFAKHCDFEAHLDTFMGSLPWWNIGSVAANIVESISPFAARKQPLELRSVALDGIGIICQAWPSNYNRKGIAITFQDVLQDDHPELQRIVLLSFRNFFAAQDRHVEARAGLGEKDLLTNGKLGGSMTANENDGAAALIAQGFLKDILRIALNSSDSDALTATEVIASITRQGLVHPKECGPALVALETSTNFKIAEVAFQQHRNLHLQHESMFEREYMRAIHEAFIYQKNVIRETTGYTTHPYRSKLRSMYEVIKTSKSKYQLKFLSNLCSKIDFDITKLDISSSPPTHLQYSRFLIENVAFFEYGRVEDVMHIISCIEKIVAGTGAGIAHSISTEIFRLHLESMATPTSGEEVATMSTTEAQAPDIDNSRLLVLTTGSMILSMLWETRTFIRRLYGINAGEHRPESKTKVTAKDLSKAPSKNNNVSGDKIIDAVVKISRSLDSRELALQQCKEFVDLLAIDSEIKVLAENDEEDERGLRTPSIDDDVDSPAVSTSGGLKYAKRKGSASAFSTPRKKKRGRPPLVGRRNSRKSVDEEENSG